MLISCLSFGNRMPLKRNRISKNCLSKRNVAYIFPFSFCDKPLRKKVRWHVILDILCLNFETERNKNSPLSSKKIFFFFRIYDLFLQRVVRHGVERAEGL